MGYYAVLQPPDGKPFQVTACHLNLWVLNALGKYLFYFDVGLHIIGKEDGVSKVHLALPFRTQVGDLKDLSTILVQRPEVASLIFGVPVQVHSHTLTFHKYGKEQKYQVMGVDVGGEAGSKRINGSDTYTLWEIKLSSALQRECDSYLRVRFTLSGLGRTWLWGADSVLFDMRVADIRGAIDAEELNKRERDIIPIRYFHIFLILPTKFTPISGRI
jgi:hypothetical protein